MKNVKVSAIALGLIAMLALAAGCGSGLKGPEQPSVIDVNTYKISKADTRISSEYPGTIEARNKVPIRSRVTGNVVEKYIHGGDYVVEGQPLYKIDGRTYDSALAAAQASAAQAQVAADNAALDLRRYEVLAQNDAIAKQVLDAQQAKAEGAQAAYRAAQAQVAIASDNVGDTIIRAPFSGTLSMDDVDLGTFVAAGQVPLVTIQSTDPVFVKFSMSENQYLQLKKEDAATNSFGDLKLRLSDNSIYPIDGKVVEVSKSLDGGSGQITLKAQFNNPDHVLLPGMFGTIITNSKEVKNAILVPTKALLPILDKTFVMVVGADGKAKQIAVTKGATTGYFTVVSGDLKDGDEIIVDGLTKVKPGTSVKGTLLTKQDIEQGK